MKKIITAILMSAIFTASVAVHAETIENVGKDNLIPIEESAEGKIEAPSESVGEAEITMEKLIALNVLDKKLCQGIKENATSRAQFVGIIIKTINGDSRQKKLYFSDVPLTHVFNAEIKTAYEMNLINGNEGKFYPDEPIKLSEAYAITVKLLGYERKAQNKGGFPSGYAAVAMELELNDGMQAQSLDGAVSKFNMYRLIDNLLEADLADFSSIKSGESNNVVYTDKTTILEKYYNISREEGTLEAVGLKNIISSTDLSDNEIIIDGKTYYGDYFSYKDFVGYNVQFYYDSDEMNILYIEKKNNREQTVAAGEIESFTVNQCKYTRDGHSFNINLADNASICYNGRPATSKTRLIPSEGSVTFIDNNHDSGYDVALIKSYTNIVTGAVIPASETLYDNYDSSVFVSFEENGNRNISFVNSSGKQNYASMLQKYEVVNCLISEDGKIVEAITGGASITGKISEIYEQDGKTQIILSKKTYPVSEKCKKYCSDFLKLNKNVCIYTDAFGTVEAISEAYLSDMHMGYVIKVGSDNKIRKTVSIKLLDMDGGIKALELSDKCTIDAESAKSPEKQLALLQLGIDNYPVISFEQNSDGQITVIDTSYYNVGEEPIEAHLSLMHSSADLIQFKGNGNCGDKFFINNQTVIFGLFANETAEEERYRVIPMTALKNDSGYQMTAYHSDNGFCASAVCVTSNSSADAVSDTTLFVVSDIKFSHDDYSDFNIVTVTNSVTKKELHMDTMKFLTLDISVGDIVRCDEIENTIIGSGMKKVYDMDKNLITEMTQSSTNDVYALRKGFVEECVGKYFSLRVTEDLKTLEYPDADNTIVVGINDVSTIITVIDCTKKDIEINRGSVNDIKPYSKACENASEVIIRYSYKSPYNIFIYLK